MSNPNIQNATSIVFNNAATSLTTTAAVQLISNSSASGKVFMVDGINIANTDTVNAVTVSVATYTAATNTGTAYELCSTVSIPANASLIVVDKSQGVSLLEAQSIYVTAGTASKLKVNASWKELS